MQRMVCGVILTIFLSRCVAYRPQPLSGGEAATQLLSRSLTDAGLQAFIEASRQRRFAVWPPPSWDLTSLVLAAFYFHPDLTVARAKWAVTQAEQQTASASPNPTITATPSYNATTLVPSPWLFVGVLDIPVETAGKRKQRMAQTAALSEAARLHLVAAAWQVRSRVRQALHALQTARELSSLLADRVALQTESVRLLEQQHAVGAVSAYEVGQARIAAQRTRFAVHDAEQAGTVAYGQLAEAVGLPLSALKDVTFSFVELDDIQAETDLATARRQALLNRPDILAALATYAASEAELRLAIARQYPDFHLTPGYEFDQGDNKWAIGPVIELPIFNHNQGPIAEAQARRVKAAADFHAVQAGVLAQIDLAIAGYRISRQQLIEADALLAALQRQEGATQARLVAGEISSLELLDLRLQLSAAAQERLAARSTARQAVGELEDALQSRLDLPEDFWRVAPRPLKTWSEKP